MAFSPLGTISFWLLGGVLPGTFWSKEHHFTFLAYFPVFSGSVLLVASSSGISACMKCLPVIVVLNRATVQ